MEGIEILRQRPFAGGTGDHPPTGSRVPVCKILTSPSSQPMLHPGNFEIAAVRGTIRILDRRRTIGEDTRELQGRLGYFKLSLRLSIFALAARLA